mgnify:CR=1 FL=1
MKPNLSERLLRSLCYALILVWCCVTLVPFVWLVIGAFKTSEDFFSSLFLPAGEGFLGIAWDRLTWNNFSKLFIEFDFSNNILNSFFIASVTSLLSTLTAAMGGFALAKYNFRGQSVITVIVLSALVIPHTLLIASQYQLLHYLGLLNSYSGLILPALSPAFGVFLFRQAMLNSVPNELLDSARVDGCGEFRIFFSVVLPLVRPMIGAYLMITFLYAWNNFINPQIVLQDAEMLPLSVAVAQLRGLYLTDYGMISAGTVISILPVALLFLLLQKEFISGLTAGAVKG